MSILQRASNLKMKNIFGEDEPNIFFNSNIKSTRIPAMSFTNYIDSKKSPIVSALKRERRKILKKQVDYDKEYEIKNIDYKTNEKKKIEKILKNTLGISLPNYSLLWRLKYLENPEIQFFFVDNLNGSYEILFVDIYHLVLPASNKLNKKKKANPKKKYKEHEKANFCLSNIFHNKNEN